MIMKHYLHPIQHCFDDAGNIWNSVLVFQVHSLQHHLIWPADEVRQTLIHSAEAGWHGGTAQRPIPTVIPQGAEKVIATGQVHKKKNPKQTNKSYVNVEIVALAKTTHRTQLEQMNLTHPRVFNVRGMHLSVSDFVVVKYNVYIKSPPFQNLGVNLH